MSDFQDHPGRPTHPDFFRIIDAVLRLDGAATEGGKGIPEILGTMADTDSTSALYIAMQRGLRAADARGLPRNRDALQVLAAGAWLDGFTAGVLSEKNRTQPKGTG